MKFDIFLSEKYRFKWAIFLALASTYGGACGQSVSVPRFPIQYGQFFNSYSIINPASCNTKAGAEFQLGRQQHGGAWKNIATTFATGSCRIRKSKSNNFHVVGLSFIRDKEGEYLKQSRGYFIYAWHTRLTKNVSLSAGATGGFFSYLISASTANVSGAATAFDGSIGLWLYSKDYYVGFSISQITNSELMPLEETTKLARHYNLTGGYSFILNRNLTFTPRILVRYCPHFPLDVDIAATTSIKELLVLGINYRYHKNVVALVGFEKIKLGNGNLRTMFSYAVPVGKIAENIQTYELTLSYNTQSGKKKTKK